MTFINMTPHALTVHCADGTIREFPSQGTARVSQRDVLSDVVDGIEIFKTEMGNVVGLPDPVDGVFIVVSRVVAAACGERQDILVPGPFLRDGEGRITGCHGFARV